MILVDLNVIFDVLQKREPHYRVSAVVLDHVVHRQVAAALPAHAVTTVHYIVQRYQDRQKANTAVDWLLKHFEIVAAARPELLRARALDWSDFEDAVVAACAESHDCEAIVTRNIKDFSGSPVPALTPDEYLLTIEPG